MAKKEGGGGRGCWKWGCIGCLGLLVVMLIILAIVAGIGRSRAKSQVVKDEVLTQELPGAVGSGEALEGDEQAAPEMRTEALQVDRENPGRVVLDLRNGGFFLFAGKAGEPLRIEATYDANNYTLVEGFDEGEGGAWTYSVSFQGKGSMMMAILGQLFGGTEPQVHVYLPPDVPLDLDVTLRDGGSQIDLGGLWLTSTSIDFARAGFQFEISEPLREPMDSLTLNGSMGGANIEGVGNASPAKVDVNLRMGGMNLDLRGRWAQDSDIHIEWDMGGANVVLPPNVAIEGVEGHDTSGPEGEVPLPTLRFELKGKMDDIEFQSPRRR